MDNQSEIKNNFSQSSVLEKDESKEIFDQSLRSLLEENLAMTKEIRAMVKHINVYVAWQRIFGWVKVFLILIPLILGIIYLPPIFEEAYHNFMKLIAGSITGGY